MAVRPTLVLFVSGWGVELSQRRFFASLPKPFLGELASVYPLAMVRAPRSVWLDQRYEQFGTIFDRHGASVQRLTTMLAEHVASDRRIADPDRFGLLTESLDGVVAVSSANRQDQLVPFPPGSRFQDAYVASLVDLKKQVLARLADAEDTIVFASFSSLWTASLYRDETFLFEVAKETSSAVEGVAQAAMAAGFTVLMCGDAPLLAGDDHSAAADVLLPCVLAHPTIEGRRYSAQDWTQGRDLPATGIASVQQVGATIAATLGLPLPKDTVTPMFAELLPLLGRV